MEVTPNINFIAIIILFGIFLGSFISWFLIKKSIKSKSPNLFMGFFILSIVLIMLEGWMNYTGYIFKALWATNFSEPLNFTVAPLIYLFTTSQLGDKRSKREWVHFIPFIFWFAYCFFFFLQPDAFKYNANIHVMQLDFPTLKTDQLFSGDPLKLRSYVNVATVLHFIIYNIIVSNLMFQIAKSKGQSVFNTTNKTIISQRNSFYHFLIITLILILVKLYFSNSDVGDYFIFLYLTFMIFTTAVQIMDRSSYFDEVSTFLEVPILKYKKSSLEEDDKIVILENIVSQMEQEKYFISNTASLSGLAKAINESSHHVSQVINEKLNQSFFELLATYRVDEAKVILKTEIGKKLTIEEIAEQVGYNSKSAFNTAFKKMTSQTPSTYRDS